jgi:hypothetical protein
MPAPVFPSWRDEVASGNYPFVDAATRTSMYGDVLSPAVVLDASVYGYSSLSVPVWVSEIRAVDEGVLFAISDLNGTLGTGYWLSSDASNEVVVLYRDETIVATILVNPVEVARIRKDNVVMYFSPSATELVISALYSFSSPAEERAVDGALLPEQGDVYLVAENGIQFECVAATETVNNVTYPVTRVNVHAIGDPLSVRAICEDGFSEPRFIKQVVFQKGTKTFTCTPVANTDIFVASVDVEGNDASLRVRQTEGGIIVGLLAKAPW